MREPILSPGVLAPAARHGLAGQFLRMVEPHTEADSAALLIQFLAAFGNAVGPGPYFQVEADRHRTNIFALVVGKTSSARKGTSWGHVRRLFEIADPPWAEKCVQHGIASGEGLIWHVRDPIYKQEGGEEVLADPGIEDKRLLVIESEFASPMKLLAREGNILSPVLRCAWETGDLRTMVKNNPAKATGTHMTVIGHITRDELLRCMDPMEMLNGFANRFVTFHVCRSKELPEGGSLSRAEIETLAAKVRDALIFGRSIGEVRRDKAARELWRRVYPELTAERPPLLGNATARAAPHVVRFSLLYAILDGSDEIRVPHLEAALALWDFSFRSAGLIFGDSLGDTVADTILAALLDADDGLPKSELHNLFSGHRGERIGRALRLLREHGLAFSIPRPTQGRPAEVWYAKGAKQAAEGPRPPEPQSETDSSSATSSTPVSEEAWCGSNAGRDWGQL